MIRTSCPSPHVRKSRRAFDSVDNSDGRQRLPACASTRIQPPASIMKPKTDLDTTAIDEREVFIRGEHVLLKVLTRRDVLESGWYGWFNDEEVCRTLQKHYFPTTPEGQLKFWEQMTAASDRLQLGICAAAGGHIVGIISLNSIDFINRKAEISVVIGDKTARNITIFVEACTLILRHGFETLNLHRIYGGSISRDLVQLMCRMLGCKDEGVARQDIYKDGAYHDAYLYGVLASEFAARR